MLIYILHSFDPYTRGHRKARSKINNAGALAPSEPRRIYVVFPSAFSGQIAIRVATTYHIDQFAHADIAN
jgi:hypothetical protein